MMADLQKLNQHKDRMLSIISFKGPSLPVQLAKAVGLTPLFASAFLSELFAEGRLKLSNMRVGSSPLYYLTGQEAKLENFVEHLNTREKEAFQLLKRSGILEDENQEPAIRVALRAIKDFAVPFSVNIENKKKLFWKYHQFPDAEAEKRIKSILTPALSQALTSAEKEIEKKIDEKAEKLAEKPLDAEKMIEKMAEKKQAVEKPLEKIEKQEKPKKAGKPRKHAEKKISLDFAEKIKGYLTSKDIELLEDIMLRKKEYAAKVRLDTLLGKQEYYLVAKDKKKITEEDLIVALQKAALLKMPALFVAKGKLDKTAETHIKEWRNLIKFEQLKF